MYPSLAVFLKLIGNSNLNVNMSNKPNHLSERDDLLGKNSDRSAATGRKEEPRPQRKREEDLGDSL